MCNATKRRRVVATTKKKNLRDIKEKQAGAPDTSGRSRRGERTETMQGRFGRRRAPQNGTQCRV